MSDCRIKYVAFYSENQARQGALSAKNKIDYICYALEKEKFKIEIVSPSWTNSLEGIYKGEKIELLENIVLKNFLTFGTKNKIGKILKCVFSLIQLTLYLLISVKKRETIVVYHSILLYYPIKIVKMIKKIKVILEVEEVYQDIHSLSRFFNYMEYKAIENADKYIFSTELLNDKLNKEKKPYVVIYGTYKVEEKNTEKFSDGRIHLVYAGTLDPRKGCLTAVSLGEYLNENYHIHILGFGKPFEVSQLLEQIRNVSTKTNCKITYEGILKGKEYIKFLQQCQIGLSPQSLNEEYNETSFPSKVLSYLANGLRVFSVKIKSLEKSSISNILYFYETTNIEEIANEIKKIKIQDKYDSRNIIEILDQKFRKDIKKMMVNTNE